MSCTRRPTAEAVARGGIVGRGMHVCHAQVGPRLVWRRAGGWWAAECMYVMHKSAHGRAGAAEARRAGAGAGSSSPDEGVRSAGSVCERQMSSRRRRGQADRVRAGDERGVTVRAVRRRPPTSRGEDSAFGERDADHAGGDVAKTPGVDLANDHDIHEQLEPEQHAPQPNSPPSRRRRPQVRRQAGRGRCRRGLRRVHASQRG
jgi:hypothetical protein